MTDHTPPQPPTEAIRVLVIVDGGCVTDVIADGDIPIEAIIKDLDNLSCSPTAARRLAANYGQGAGLSPSFRGILLDGLPEPGLLNANDNEQRTISNAAGRQPGHAAPVPTEPNIAIPEIASLTDQQARAILAGIFQWLYRDDDGSFTADKEISGGDTVDYLLTIMPPPGASLPDAPATARPPGRSECA